jgi:hypothetical protein
MHAFFVDPFFAAFSMRKHRWGNDLRLCIWGRVVMHVMQKQ